MARIPLPDSANENEWVRSVAHAMGVDEQSLRATVSAYHDAFQPLDSEKQAALKNVVTDAYYKTSETPYDNAPEGHVQVQFPIDGELGAHYEYYCHNPAHPAPSHLTPGNGRNWTYVTHTVTHVTDHLRTVMRDIDHVQTSESHTSLDSEFDDDEITIARVVPGPDFRTTKRILTDGYALNFTDIYDAWGTFHSEWHDARLYWNEQ